VNHPIDSDQDHGDAKISRRNFLKCTGTIIFIVGTGKFIPISRGYGKQLGRDKIKTEIPPSQGYLLIDTKKCQGCTSCMLACTLVHEGVENPSLARIQIIQNPFESFPDDVTIAHCRQCVDPACVKACPADALRADSAVGNVRMIDRSKCIGCGDCIDACPFTPSRPVVALDENFDDDPKGRKCDLCANTPYHWDAAGGGPKGQQACVEVCPVGAITFTEKIPEQQGDRGYLVNLRATNWQRLGYPID
jgi:protein NrfC